MLSSVPVAGVESTVVPFGSVVSASVTVNVRGDASGKPLSVVATLNVVDD